MSGRGVVTVATIGLQLHEQSILKCVFNLSAAREQSYALATPDQSPDILLVDGDIPEAVSAWRLRCKSDQRLAGLPTVLVTKAEPLAAPDLYPLKRPLVASRVYTVLDPIAAQLRGSEAAARVMHHRALVVDDSPTTRKQIELELERLGIAADLAESADEAFAWLNKDQPYDLIFLDVVLPGVDGYKICKTIKKDKRRKGTPVIMLTGKGSPFDRVRGKFAGCNTYLVKPVGTERFQATVKKYLP